MSEQLVWRSAVEQAAMVAGRQISARELVEAQLERIAAVNPRINAIVTLVPDRALAEAGELDRRLAAGEQPGPLHGLPVAVKDLVDTAGIRTTQGSPLFADHVPVQDDLLVTRLRGAGAVIVGKTNTPEFGAGSHTFNPVFGLTRNPWDASRTAGGSSGGAAAAVAAGMLPVADGSDMGGSLRNPAAFCNVCGLRPSPGRWWASARRCGNGRRRCRRRSGRRSRWRKGRRAGAPIASPPSAAGRPATASPGKCCGSSIARTWTGASHAITSPTRRPPPRFSGRICGNLVSQNRKTCWGMSNSSATSLIVRKAVADFSPRVERSVIA